MILLMWKHCTQTTVFKSQNDCHMPASFKQPFFYVGCSFPKMNFIDLYVRFYIQNLSAGGDEKS